MSISSEKEDSIMIYACIMGSVKIELNITDDKILFYMNNLIRSINVSNKIDIGSSLFFSFYELWYRKLVLLLMFTSIAKLYSDASPKLGIH